MTRVVISPRADRDLEDIWFKIAAENPSIATRVVRAIAVKIDRWADQPRRGPRRPDIRSRMRMLVEEPYLVLFEAYPDTDEVPVDEVNIVRVVDGRRDMTNRF